MSSVPKSQYDELQKRHENLRKRTATVQRKNAKLEAEVKMLRAAADAMLEERK